MAPIRTVTTNGVELAVLEAGDPERPTVLLIHGWPDTKEMWAPVIAELEPRFHVVAYDVRGAGASSAPRGLGAYDFDRLAGDAGAVIEAVSPDRPVHLVGHDWGGMQGWELVTRPGFKGRIASFTAIAGPSLDQIGISFQRKLWPPTPGGLAEVGKRLARSWYVFVLLTPGGPTVLRRGLLGGQRYRTFMRAVERVAERDGYPLQSGAGDALKGSRLYRRNMPRRLLMPRRDAVAHVPVQLIVPHRDHFIPRGYYDLAEEHAPLGLRRRQIAGGHFVPRQQPVRIAAWIREHAEQVEAGNQAPVVRPWVRGGGVEQLEGRLALVTGAGSGIGQATALALAAHGARLLLVDSGADGLAETAAQISGAHTFSCDVSDPEAMQRLANAVLAEHGIPDVVINNAGIGVAGSFFDTGFDDWRRVIDVNLHGVVHGCKLFGQAMIDRGGGGQIVNTSSAAGYQPTKDLAAYSASKAAVLMLSECLRGELASHGIGVTAICPGVVATPITRATKYVGRDQASTADVMTKIYERRNFTAEQVAAEIVAAIANDTAVAPVTPEAKAARALSRLSPELARRLGAVDALPA